ncbi:MAG: RDD family protein, partial [Acidobacteria bacterium]
SDAASRVSPGQAVGRTLLLAVSLLPAGLGLVSVLLDGSRRGLHDRLSGTRVVPAAGS